MEKNMHKVVLVRHGESLWNAQKRFCGWADVDLAKKGVLEAHTAGKALKEQGYTFDLAYTSVLQRAIKTLRIILEEMDLREIPIRQSWRLNERHYGALQGLNHADTAKEYGEEQVHIWRRSYNTRPPLLEKSDPRWQGKDPLYKGVPAKDIPLGESLKDTLLRVRPCWKAIGKDILKGKKVIISASHNSLRALVKDLDSIPDQDIMELNIPTGIPLVYELDEKLRPLKHYYLADEKTVQEAIERRK